MTWYNSGNWDGLRVDKLAEIMHNVCSAINERQTAVGVTLTTWYKGNGTLGTNPSAADMAGFFLGDYVDTDANDTRWDDNRDRAIAAVKALAPYFWDDNLCSNRLTAADLEDFSTTYPGAFEDYDGSPETHLDVRIWIKLKETIVKLRYRMYSPNVSDPSGHEEGYGLGTDEDNLVGAWANAVADLSAVPSGFMGVLHEINGQTLSGGPPDLFYGIIFRHDGGNIIVNASGITLDPADDLMWVRGSIRVTRTQSGNWPCDYGSGPSITLMGTTKDCTTAGDFFAYDFTPTWFTPGYASNVVPFSMAGTETLDGSIDAFPGSRPLGGYNAEYEVIVLFDGGVDVGVDLYGRFTYQ